MIDDLCPSHRPILAPLLSAQRLPLQLLRLHHPAQHVVHLPAPSRILPRCPQLSRPQHPSPLQERQYHLVGGLLEVATPPSPLGRLLGGRSLWDLRLAHSETLHGL